MQHIQIVDLEKVPEKNQKEIVELKVVSAKLEESRKTVEAEVDKVLASVREETQELQDRKEVLLNELMGLTATRDKAKSAVSQILSYCLDWNIIE